MDVMDPITVTTIAVFVAELIAAPIIVGVVNRKLNRFDEKREIARHERAEDRKREREQRQREHDLMLAMSRTMLLNNYENCMNKGYYSVEEREIYHELASVYGMCGGNGVIKNLGEKLRQLPTEPPEEDE